MSTTGWRAGRSIALRFEPEAGTGGLKPYLHVRRDLWAKVTRALFFDLVELGEERDVDGCGDVRGGVGGHILSDGAGRPGEGFCVNESGSAGDAAAQASSTRKTFLIVPARD